MVDGNFKYMLIINENSPIVPPIRCPDDSMDMKLCRVLVHQKHARMVVKLDEHNRALNPVVKGIGVFKTTNPAEIGLVPVLLDLG